MRQEEGFHGMYKTSLSTENMGLDRHGLWYEDTGLRNLAFTVVGQPCTVDKADRKAIGLAGDPK